MSRFNDGFWQAGFMIDAGKILPMEMCSSGHGLFSVFDNVSVEQI